MTILQSSIVPSTGGYQISRSLRFNSADSAYLNRTPASASNRKTWTWSGWVKRSGLTNDMYLFEGRSTDANRTFFRIAGDNTLIFSITSSDWLQTTAVFRDPSAWYHIVYAFDTTQATQTDRVKLYVNGVQQTITATFGTGWPTQNSDYFVNGANGHTLGAWNGGIYFNGYMTEINFIDGQALTPSSFGRNNPNTGVWEPIAYTGTYGTNGFELSFADNSNTTAATLGKDYSGNGNNWTPNNFSVTAGAGNDSLVDTPTSYGVDTGVGGEVRGNYATTSPINQIGTALTLANGNLDFTQGSSLYGLSVCTMSIRDKTYFEITINATGVGRNSYDGVGSSGSANAYSSGGFFGTDATAWSLGYSNTTAYISNNGVQSTQSGTIANGDVFMYAVDPANGRIWFGRNGTWYAGNPSAGTGASYTNLPSEVWPVVQAYNSGAHSINFGQRPFAHTAPSGFKALCTQNLPTPTIGATSTTQAGKYFNPVLYTGNGSTQSITGVGFQPDFVWIKNRGTVTDHGLFDAIRGTTKRLSSNLTNAETTEVNSLTAFNSDGFSVGATQDFNQNTVGIVAWNWKASGAGSSNTSGTITSTVSANTTAGFSIVTYTGTGSNATVGHGLGVAPRMFITKNRDSGTPGWAVYHASVGNTGALALNATTAVDTNSVYFNNTTPTSTVFSVGTGTAVNTNTQKYVAYCFAAVAGYSAFGSYTGNGSTDGPFVYTGFRPRWMMIKTTSAGNGWQIRDTSRSPFNTSLQVLSANSANAEISSAGNEFDILSNGFKVRNSGGDLNTNGNTYIYAAFAESPFKFSLAR